MQMHIGGKRNLYAMLVNGCPPSGEQPLPVPTSTSPGEWFTISPEHNITNEPASIWRHGGKLYLVEIDAEDDTRARLVGRPLTAKQMESLNIFVKGSYSITSGNAAVSGTAVLEATGPTVTVYASGNSLTVARGGVLVLASERAKGRCYDSRLIARGHANFSLFGECTAKATEKATIIGRGYSKIDTAGETHVDVFDFCQVFGEGTPTIRGFNRARIWASDLSKVKTNDESKAWVRHQVRATADGSSQIFAAPGVSVQPRNFAVVAQLQAWPEVARLTS